MRRFFGWLALAALLAAGCTENPAKIKGEDQTMEGAAPAGGVVYNPKTDPLVNPPALFEPYPAAQSQKADDNAVVIRLLRGNPDSLNPIFGSSAYEFQIEGLIFNGLFMSDQHNKWMINPDTVVSCVDSADHLVTTVKIKPGLKWQDGQPWTAQDVVFSYREIMDDRVPVPAVRTGTDQLADVRALDDLTVEFRHKQALPTNKWNMSFPIIPKHIFGVPGELAKDPSLRTSDYYNRYNRVKIVGSGPYRFVEWITNDRIVLERWDGYQGTKPHFSKMIFKLQPDSSVALLMFKRGELDEMSLTAQQFATQTGDAEFKRHGVKAYGPEWGYAYIGWNLVRGWKLNGEDFSIFSDAQVRRAMTHALNIPLLIRTLEYNLVTPCYGIFHPTSWMFNPDIKLLEYDLNKAARLLDEAGWKVNPDDGWRYKTFKGQQVKFEFTLLIPQGSAAGEKVAAVYMQDLKKIGVSLRTRVLEWATFSEDVHKHEFQAQMAGWGSGSDPDGEWNLWRSDEYMTGRNFGGYANPEVDKLLELGRHEFDEARRAEDYRQVQKLIYDDQPYIFMWNTMTLEALSTRMRGIGFSPGGIAGYYPGDLGWWVPRELPAR
ncbi:MAG: ABC transporter substrate-binding protein [bacterium]|nr:ABC transporter substrate-binding protein [bacterium]